MAETAESSSIPSKNDKPVIVRVKRIAFHSPLEAFWLEINERPLKRPLLDFEKLSISNSSAKEELKSKKIFVHHVETVSSSEDTVDILHTFVLSKPSSENAVETKAKGDERRCTFKADNKQDQLLVKAKEKQEVLSKNARFEQIWRSRKGKKGAMHGEELRGMCHLYDIVRVDAEETNNEVQKQEETDLEDHRIMSSFLPLLREFIPSAAEEIESEINNHTCKQASEDDFLYDLYAVKDDDISMMEKDSSNPFPLVQVDDDENYYDGPEESEFESDDSNAEDNPLNDYPDEVSSGEDEEVENKSSDNVSEEHETETTSDKSSESEDLGNHDWSGDADSLFEDEIYGEDDGGEMHNYNDDGRWSYR